MELLILGVTHCGLVFLKALQNLNVVNGNMGWLFPVALGLGFCEVYIISTLAIRATGGARVVSALSLGSGGFIGSILAIIFHRKWVL